jgi:hypothetical protein
LYRYGVVAVKVWVLLVGLQKFVRLSLTALPEERPANTSKIANPAIQQLANNWSIN